MAKHISCDFKCKFNSTTCNSKKNYPWITRTPICENSKYWKSNADTLVIAFDEIICYGHCIDKKDKYYTKKCVNKLLQWESKV